MAQSKAFVNAKWIIACKIIQSLLQMLIGMITARFLGPANYGLISYAASLTAFALPFSQLGLSSTLVREYVSTPDREGVITGTAIVMSMASSFLCMVCVLAFVFVFNATEPITICVCVLYSSSLFFQSMQLVQYWFQAKLQAKYSSIASLLAYVVVSAYKIMLLVCEKSIYWFALIHSVEYGVTGLLMLVAYRNRYGAKLRVSRKLAAELYSRSKYYILASFMVVVFQNADHIMLKVILGDEANGLYTTAVTCAGVAHFVYMAIVDSACPVILRKKEKSQEEFEQSISALYSVMLYMSLAQSVCFTIFAKYIVLILYGESYMAAVPILKIYAWILSFSYMGTVRNVWILAEEKHGILWIINLCGAAASVLLNSILIPLWGAAGASAAAIATQIITNFVIGFVIKTMRKNNYLLIKGMNPFGVKYFYKLMRQDAG